MFRPQPLWISLWKLGEIIGRTVEFSLQRDTTVSHLCTRVDNAVYVHG